MIDQYFLRSSVRLGGIAVLLFCLCLVGTSVLRAQDVSRVRAVQLVPDAPAIDVYLDDITPASITGIGYLDASRSLRLPPGTHNVKIAASGAPKETAVINQNVPFNNDTAYTIFSTGRLASLNVQPVILTRWLGLAPTPGRSLLRVLHGSLETGNVNITITDAIGSQTALTGVAFRTSSDYLPVPEGSLDVVVSDPQGTQIYKATGIIPQGALMTLVAVGDPASKTFKLSVLFDSDTLSRSPMDTLRAVAQNPLGNMRFAQVSADLETVDVGLLNLSEPSENLNFRSASAMQSHPAGVYQASVLRPGGEALVTKDVDVIADFTQTAYVVGNPAEGTADLVVLTTDPSAQPSGGKSSIRFLNAVTGADVVNVELKFSDGSTRPINSSGFRNFVPYQAATPGLASVRVTTADGTSQLLLATGTIPSGVIGTLVLTGSAGGNLAVNLLIDSDDNAQAPMILFDVLTGVESHRAVLSRMEVAPNPVRDRMALRFSIDRPTGLHFGLYDITGRTLMDSDLGSREAGDHIFPVDLGEIPSGTYIVLLRDDAGRTVGSQRIEVR